MALTHMLDVNIAKQMAERRGFKAHERDGYLVVINVSELGRTMVTPDGFVSRHAFDRIIGQSDAPAAK